MGVCVILAAGTIGIGWRHLRRPSLKEISGRELYLFGVIVHLVMLALVFTLPWDSVFGVLSSISLPVLVIYPIGTALLGYLMVSRLKREQSSDILKESQKRLRLAVEASNIGFFDRDLLTNQVHFSAEWKNQLGYAVDEISEDSKEWESRIHPDDLPSVLNRVNDYINGLRPNYESEYRLRHKDGSYRWILARGSLLQNPNGKAIRLLGCHVDITRQKQNEEAIYRDNIALKQAEQALKKSEEKYRVLTENIKDVVWILDIDSMNFRYVSPSVERLRGYTPEEILSLPVDYALTATAKAGVFSLIQSRKEDFLSGKRPTTTFYTEEVEQPCKDGSTVWTEAVTTYYLNEETGHVEVRGVSRDLTDRKQALIRLQKSETHYRSLFENMLNGFAYCQMLFENKIACDFIYLDVNKEFEHLTGLKNAIGKKVSELIPGIRESDPKLFEIYGRVALTGKPEIFEMYIKALNDWYSISVYCPQTEYFVAIFDVVTDQKHAEAKVQAAQAELQRLLNEADQSHLALLSLVEDQKLAQERINQLNVELEERVRDRTIQLESTNKELEAFVYSVSHDLRAPLRAMNGFSAALFQDYPDRLDEKGRHYLERIQEASRRMGQLINDLLSLSRVTRADFTRMQVDLSVMAKEIADDLKTQDPQRNVEFIISPGLIAQGDSNLLKIVFENLLNNAVKFTGTVEQAHIQVGAVEMDGERVYFVRDNGVGFDMEYAGKLFAPFQRLHSMQEFPGTGIGLVTVQRIIYRHGGRIWPEAVVNQGATFYFTLGGE